MHTGIVGLGYVGVPLSTTFADAGFPVTGYDVDEERIDSHRANRSAIAKPAGAPSRGGTKAPDYTTDPESLTACGVIVTAVPTPLGDGSGSGLSRVRAAGRTIGDRLTPESTVVLESTVSPGATRSEFVPELEEMSGLCLEVESPVVVDTTGCLGEPNEADVIYRGLK